MSVTMTPLGIMLPFLDDDLGVSVHVSYFKYLHSVANFGRFIILEEHLLNDPSIFHSFVSSLINQSN